MIDLRSTKICFMDFDDTICLQLDRRINTDYYKCMINRDSSFYDRPHRAIGKGIPEFVSECCKQHIDLYVLTWSHSNLMYHAELDYVTRHFGIGTFKDVIIASSHEYKIDVMEHFSSALDIAPRKILLIDDVPETVSRAYSNGFMVGTPQEVALMFGG